jgi:hypothetical protein
MSEYPVEFSECDAQVFPFSEDIFMPSETFVQMNSKIFNIICLRERFIVDINYGTGFSAIGESDMS